MHIPLNIFNLLQKGRQWFVNTMVFFILIVMFVNHVLLHMKMFTNHKKNNVLSYINIEFHFVRLIYIQFLQISVFQN